MSEDPFAEPGEQDRTVIRPMPGGRRPGLRAAPPAPSSPISPPPATVVASGPDIEAITTGTGPLGFAAAPLLHLLARLRNTVQAPDAGDMRDRTRRALRAFERRAYAQGVPADQVRQAHYALCASLDDVVLNTPWGREGRWHDEPLARTLHHDEHAARGFFEQLRTARDALPASLPIVELMFVCLSLGMMGPYRAAPDGPIQLERIRHHVFELIARHAPASAAALAPDATGVDARFVPRRSGVPVWVAASAALALLAAVYMWSLTSINAASDAVYRAASIAPPAVMPALVRPPANPPPPPPPRPAEPGPDTRLRAALSALPDVQVIGGASATILRIPASVLFPQANATVGATALLRRVAEALRKETGPIRVIAFTDSQPSRSVRFPSNFALSTARAKAVSAALARELADPNRISAEGRADADPIAPNTTVDGRERNRRIEILLPVVP